ncbi:hypothetical protein KFO65_13860, partial [Enterococcus faecalis]|uniref:hypothetical protein n=1 Tax=Enterococcus faecalis TaxID=1351 RepID=UPI001BA78653
PPALPAHRWSLRHRDLRTLDTAALGDRWVASIGVGTVFADRPAPARALAPALADLHARLMAGVAPHGRLNPRRDAALR